MATVEELFQNMPAALNVEKAKDVNVVVQFDLSGDEGGQWYVNVADGTANTNQGVHENPDATVRMDAQDYKDLVAGRLNPINAFMTGKVKVEGDLNTVMKFQTLFD